jgi:predicted site-specific integrase-resolvase
MPNTTSDKQRDAASGPAMLAPFPRKADFCREEGVSASTVARLATTGLIRVIKTGRNTRVDRQSWYDYLNSRPTVTYRVGGRQERATT